MKTWQVFVIAFVLVVSVAIISRAMPLLPPVNADMNCTSAGQEIVFNGTSLVCANDPASPQSARLTTNTSGTVTWNYPAACNTGNVPIITATVEGPNPVNGISLNVQTVGSPGTSSVIFQITKQTATTVALLGLTIAVTATGTGIGAATVDAVCYPQ